MHRNTYLGECVCLVYSPSVEEIRFDALQMPFVLVFIKSKLDLSHIHTVEDFQSNDIFSSEQPILLRISSECLTGIFGDAHCDCESQRISSLREINFVGQGIYIHFPQEGQGNGLSYKVKELELQINGVDSSGVFVGEKNIQEAAEYLLGRNRPLDKRNYSCLSRIFRGLNLGRYTYELISDNSSKNNYFKKEIGIKINSLRSVKRIITVENAGEYLAKLYMKDFEIADLELQDIYFALFSAKELPARVISLLRFIEEDLSYGKQFRANDELLNKIISLHKTKQGAENIQNLELFKDSVSYTEYQTELAIDKKEVDLLFHKKVFTNDESLHYEENYFYDLIYFKGVPARSLKIRKSFRLMDRLHPLSQKLIYKVPLHNKNYIIKSIPITHEDITVLIGLALRDYEIHFLPVFTHNLSVSIADLTVLLKRYSQDLRTLSLMGSEIKVKEFIECLRNFIDIEEVDDPTNHRYLRRDISLGFQWDILSTEELEIFKQYHKG